MPDRNRNPERGNAAQEDRIRHKRDRADGYRDHSEPDQNVEGERAGLFHGQALELVGFRLRDFPVLKQLRMIEYDLHGIPPAMPHGFIA